MHNVLPHYYGKFCPVYLVACVVSSLPPLVSDICASREELGGKPAPQQTQLAKLQPHTYKPVGKHYSLVSQQ